jgi:adenine-specific DNA-methyltransferase
MAEEFKPTFSFSDDRLNELKTLFPEAFEDGVFNLDVLKDLIGNYSTDNSIKEHFGLNWVGKVDARRMSGKMPTGTLRVRSEDNIKNDAIKNIFIEGDNLESLKILRKSYSGKVKMIYIDPPYNTGNDFVYKDNFADSTEDYLKKSGDVSEEGLLVSNPKTSGKYHANWLSFIYPRLRIAKDLLAKDGVIFVSIDQNEFHHLKLVMDEIFDQENCAGDITVINNFKGRSDDKFIATAHEYLLIYHNGEFETQGVPMPEEYKKEYKLGESSNPYRQLGLRKRGANSKREDRPNMYYPFFYNEFTKVLALNKSNEADIEILPRLSDGSDGCWRWGKDTAIKRLDELEVKLVSGREEYDVFQKDYLYNENGKIKSVKAKSFWLGPEFSSESGTLEFKNEVGFAAFETPKPKSLIKYCLHQAIKSDGDIVLDFFAGSGTTAIACKEFTNETNINCNFILIQIPAKVKEGHPAYKKNLKTIADITKFRLDANGIEYRHYIQEKSNIYKWNDFDPSNGGIVELSKQLQLALKTPIKDGSTEYDVLTEIILQKGFSLTSKVSEISNLIYKISDSSIKFNLFIFLKGKLLNADLENLDLEETDHFVCLDNSFESDTLKQNLENRCKLFTI